MVALLDKLSTQTTLSRMKDISVMVVGDLMLDEYIWGSADRISPEAPVPVVLWEDRTFAPGGAANVVNNITAFGARAVVCGVIGNDRPGERLLDKLREQNVDVGGIVADASRPTTRKMRIFARSQQILRLDQETVEPLSATANEELKQRILDRLDDVDVVLFSDYAKGCLTHDLVQGVIAAARERGRLVTAGPKPNTLNIFAGATLVSFNRSEAAAACGFRVHTDEQVERAGRKLLDELGTEALVITRSGDGATLFVTGASPEHVPAHPIQVFDECGAGDTFLGATTLGLAADRDFSQAVALGNVAAAIAVSRVGVVPVSSADILGLWSSDK